MTLLVHPRHMRALKYCARGARAFFRRHGLDWQRFITTGIPAEELIATGDAMAAAVVDQAKREEQANG